MSTPEVPSVRPPQNASFITSSVRKKRRVASAEPVKCPVALNLDVTRLATSERAANYDKASAAPSTSGRPGTTPTGTDGSTRPKGVLETIFSPVFGLFRSGGEAGEASAGAEPPTPGTSPGAQASSSGAAGDLQEEQKRGSETELDDTNKKTPTGASQPPSGGTTADAGNAAHGDNQRDEPSCAPCATVVPGGTKPVGAAGPCLPPRQPPSGNVAPAGPRLPPRPAALENGREESPEDVDEWNDAFYFIKSLPALSACVDASARPTILPKKTRSCKQKTLVLDLDETLVHSSLEPVEAPDFSFSVHFNEADHVVNVRMRPHLRQFLTRAAALFEVVIFTASQHFYAEQLLNILDPKRQLVRHRVFRDSCVFVEGYYLKDLSSLGRDLRHTIIIDNSPQAFGFQVENGIPIVSWYDDEKDEELLRMLPFLERLAADSVQDVRPIISDTFRLRERIEGCS